MAKQKPKPQAEQFTEHERTAFLYRTVEEMRLINDAIEMRYQSNGRPDGRREDDER